MIRLSRFLILFVLFVAVVFGTIGVVVASEPTADAARVALKKQSFPWYDATKDEFRPLRDSEIAPTRNNFEGMNGNVSWFAPLLRILLWSILAVIVAGLLFIIIRAAMNADLRTGQSSDQEKPAADVNLEALEALPAPTRGVSDLLAEAARLASQSAFGSAMTFYYSWQLMQLDKWQLIEVQKGKTNRQYAREVSAAKPELVDIFSRSTRLFEDAFFGDLPVSSENFQQVWDQRERFQFAPKRTRS